LKIKNHQGFFVVFNDRKCAHFIHLRVLSSSICMKN